MAPKSIVHNAPFHCQNAFGGMTNPYALWKSLLGCIWRKSYNTGTKLNIHENKLENSLPIQWGDSFCNVFRQFHFTHSTAAAHRLRRLGIKAIAWHATLHNQIILNSTAAKCRELSDQLVSLGRTGRTELKMKTESLRCSKLQKKWQVSTFNHCVNDLIRLLMYHLSAFTPAKLP